MNLRKSHVNVIKIDSILDSILLKKRILIILILKKIRKVPQKLYAEKLLFLITF